MCRLCWEPPLSIVTRVRHTLCTQSDNLTAGTKHRCEFHTSKTTCIKYIKWILLIQKDAIQRAREKQTELLLIRSHQIVLYLWNFVPKSAKPLFQIKVGANICPGGLLTCCFNVTHQGCAATLHQ